MPPPAGKGGGGADERCRGLGYDDGDVGGILEAGDHDRPLAGDRVDAVYGAVGETKDAVVGDEMSPSGAKAMSIGLNSVGQIIRP